MHRQREHSMTEPVKTAAPARKRVPAAAKKTTPVKPATVPGVQASDGTATGEVEKTVIHLVAHPEGPTVRFERFVAPEDSGCRGTIYAPLGTTEVRVALISGV
jgi:hypothetical protein